MLGSRVGLKHNINNALTTPLACQHTIMSKKAKRIISLSKKIKCDHKNSNMYLEILENIQAEGDEVVNACCDSAGKVFSHFIEATDFIDTEIETDKADLPKDEQFHHWLQEQYKTTCDILLSHLTHESLSVQIASMEALTAILGSLGQKSSKACSSNSREMLEKIIQSLLSKDRDRGKMIALLPALLSACPKDGEMLKICLTHIHQHLKEAENVTDMEAFNIWHFVVQTISGLEMDMKAKSLLNKIVLGFLRTQLPLKLYKDILTSIDAVMEKMTTPLLLADFLSQSFNVGGAISLMSLNGLFVLMHKYNLNYPDFYEKLYSLFQPQIFGAKYRARFFHLADLFLSSTHLPSYLVAAFVKRMARLALHAPASGVQILIPFIFTLISRHPACDVLLHRQDGPTEFDADPYLEEESILNCKALDSCLWELKTLEHHFDPNISIKAKKRQIKEEDLSRYLDQTVTEIIESEAKKKKKDVPLTFEKSTDFELLGRFVI